MTSLGNLRNGGIPMEMVLETTLVVGKVMLVRSPMAIQPLIDMVVLMPMATAGQMMVTIYLMKSRSGLTAMVMALVKTPLE